MKNVVKWIKKSWKQPKKVFWSAFGCAQHPEASQNTQQPTLHGYIKVDVKVNTCIHVYHILSMN